MTQTAGLGTPSPSPLPSGWPETGPGAPGHRDEHIRRVRHGRDLAGFRHDAQMSVMLAGSKWATSVQGAFRAGVEGGAARRVVVLVSSPATDPCRVVAAIHSDTLEQSRVVEGAKQP